MYKVYRVPQKAQKYEVMLSPFRNLIEVQQYIEKYSIYYPVEEQQYLIVAENNVELSNLNS